MENEEKMDAVFGALADRRRRQILQALAEAPRAVGDIAVVVGLKISATSKHVAVLEEAGLVLKGRNGRGVICHLNFDAWKDVAAYIGMYSRFWAGRLEELDKYLKEVQSGA